MHQAIRLSLPATFLKVRQTQEILFKTRLGFLKGR